MTEEINKELNDLMQHCLKVSGTNYLLYNREWLYEHLDFEFELLKKMAERKEDDIN